RSAARGRITADELRRLGGAGSVELGVHLERVLDELRAALLVARGHPDRAGVVEEAGVAGAERERLVDRRARVREPPRPVEGPGAGVLGVDVVADLALGFGEADGLVALAILGGVE